jgi:PAS domain S-box-containing protein
MISSVARRPIVSALLLVLAVAAPSAAQTAARNVLILSSFERAFDPHSTYMKSFRSELSRRSPDPINFFEVSIQPAPFGPVPAEEPVVNYLRSIISGTRLDLVVSVGGPSAVFARKYREAIFPATPLLQTAVDQRWVQGQPSTGHETAVAVAMDLPGLIDDVLQLLPDTTNVFVAIGTSPYEEFWRGHLSREVEKFRGRLTFNWFNELSFEEMLKRSATLPARSVIFYAVLTVDAKGVVVSDDRALQELHAVANAPIFGLYDIQLGHGVVGGHLVTILESGREAAGVGLRLLRGEPPATIKTAPQGPGAPTYDWRELQRWGIGEARLPPGSVVRFRQPSVWDQYKRYIVGAALLLGLQTMLITGLVVQHARRRRSELALRESEERFRLMANGAPVMVWTAGPDTATDFFNSTVLEFTGLPIEALLGNGWRNRIHPDDVDRCVSSYMSAFDARQPIKMEYRFRRADDTYRWVLDTGVPRYGPDGTFVGYIGSALDITERREMEQSLLANEAALRHAFEQNRDLAGRLINAQEVERRRIARDLHDDLSQQLAGVAIMLSGLKRLAAKPNAQPEVDRAVTTLQERTSSLAQSVRTLSHQLHPNVLQHSGLVETLKQHCAEVQKHHDVEVVLTSSGDLGALSPDVSLCLFRVAQEALANAVRHAGARRIQVQFTGTRDSVELSIADNGLGFVTSEKMGSGLGLRSIDERVRLTRGDVQVDSRLGHGTTVRVRIPLAPAPAGLVEQP